MTLIATPAAANANSYSTVAEADAYFNDRRLYTTDWTSAASEDKEKALIWATAILDVAFDWFGTPTTTTQALRWPRSGLTDRDGFQVIDHNTIPEAIKVATAELALDLIKNDHSVRPGLLDQGFKRVKVGPISIEVDDSQVKNMVSNWIVSLLTDFGSPSAAMSQDEGSGTLRVERY